MRLHALAEAGTDNSDYSYGATSSDFSLPSFSNPFGGDTDWSKIISQGLNVYGAVKTTEIKADSQAAQLAAQQRLMYPYGQVLYGANGLPLPTIGQPGYTPFPGLVSATGGMSTTTLIGLGGLVIALMMYMKQN